MSEQDGGGPALFPLRRRADHLVLLSRQASVDFAAGQARMLRDLGLADDPWVVSMEKWAEELREIIEKDVGRVEIRTLEGSTVPVRPKAAPKAAPKHEPKPKARAAQGKPRLSLVPGGAA